MGHEGSNTEATVKELYNVFINSKDIYEQAANIKERFESGLFTELWLSTQFSKIAKMCIFRIYRNQCCDKQWIVDTLGDEEIVEALASKLREYIMTELEE